MNTFQTIVGRGEGEGGKRGREEGDVRNVRERNGMEDCAYAKDIGHQPLREPMSHPPSHDPSEVGHQGTDAQ